MVTRWVFRDLYQKGLAPYSYTVHINPNEGGSPTVTKNMTILSNTGPNRAAIAQEGQSSMPEISFSGVILEKAHYEALEYWYSKRILIEITDDLGRVFRGIFSRWEPNRQRRAFNPWYHTFSAGMTVTSYRNASGQVRYGKFI